MNRRKFLVNGGLSIAGTMLYSKYGFAEPAAETLLGIQLYSIRDEMEKTPWVL
jgi:hypothetical protein